MIFYKKIKLLAQVIKETKEIGDQIKGYRLKGQFHHQKYKNIPKNNKWIG